MADRLAAIHPPLAPMDFVQQQQVIAPRRARARLLMINSGTLLISAAWSVIMIHSASGTDDPFPTAAGGPACALVAFLLFLLGVSLVLLALVAERFPRAARVGVAIARALRRYLLGLGW